MAITDGTYRLGDAARLASAGITYIQLRDKSLPAGELTGIARNLLAEVRGTPTRLLINSRADIALAAGAHGVHLTSAADELTPAHIRQLFSRAHAPTPTISISCHSTPEAARARALAADLILFAPVFEKRVDGTLVSEGLGLATLREACAAAAPVPVLALGGVTAVNTAACIEAGAAGIASIRLFAHEPAAPSSASQKEA